MSGIIQIDASILDPTAKNKNGNLINARIIEDYDGNTFKVEIIGRKVCTLIRKHEIEKTISLEG